MVPYISVDNTTYAALSGAATFTGVWENVAQFTSVVCALKADVAGTLYIEFSDSRDDSTADSSLSYDIAANINEVHKLTVTRAFFRIRFVNGSAAQSAFTLQSLVGQHGLLTAPANLTLGQDADAIAVRSIEAQSDIAEGKRAGNAIVNKFGFNPDIDTGTVPEDIWFNGGVYTGFPLGAAELVTVSSSNANDTSAGSGAQTVQIYGLDANGDEQTETVSLNGVSLVDSVGSYTRCHRIVVRTSGASNTAFNAGILTVAHKTTTANIFTAAPIGTNQSQVAAYTIPAGKTGYLRDFRVTMERSNTSTAKGALWVRNNGASPRLVRNFSLSQLDSVHDEIYGGIVLPALTDITIRITSVSANNIEFFARFDLIVVDN